MEAPKRYYSLVVMSPVEIYLAEHFTILVPGLNVFSVTTSSIDKLMEFLVDKGCKVVGCNKLDEFEPQSIELMLGVGHETVDE